MGVGWRIDLLRSQGRQSRQKGRGQQEAKNRADFFHMSSSLRVVLKYPYFIKSITINIFSQVFRLHREKIYKKFHLNLKK